MLKRLLVDQLVLVADLLQPFVEVLEERVEGVEDLLLERVLVVGVVDLLLL